MLNIGVVLESFCITALWLSADDNDEPLDSNYSIEDIDKNSLALLCTRLLTFINKHDTLISDYEGGSSQFGNDLWLTSQGHGVGFWDRGLEELGDKLAEISKELAGIDLYVGDNGSLYFSGYEG